MITFAQANLLVYLASQLGATRVDTQLARTNEMCSMVTADSSKRRKLAERALIEYIDTLRDQEEMLHIDNLVESEAWRDLKQSVGLK